MGNGKKTISSPETKILSRLLLVTFPSSSPLALDRVKEISSQHDESPVLIKLEGGRCVLHAISSDNVDETIAREGFSSSDISSIFLLYDDSEKEWRVCGREMDGSLAESKKISLESYLGRWLGGHDLSYVQEHIDDAQLLEGALLHLNRTKILLYSSDCVAQPMELTADDCGSCLRYLTFPNLGQPATFLVDEQLSDFIGDAVPLIVGSVNRVSAIAEEVALRAESGKVHQAFALLLTGAYSEEYRSAYKSSLNESRVGVCGLCSDLISLACKADLEFGLVFFAVRAILDLTAEKDFTRAVLSPKVFGLSGCTHWWHEDFLLERAKHFITYLNSLTLADIDRANVVVIAAMSLSLLCKKNKGIRTDQPAFRLFDRETNVELCLASVEFRALFNRVVSNSLQTFDDLDESYPKAVFLVVKRAYTTGYLELTGHENVLLQILNDKTRCCEFVSAFPKICADILSNGFTKAAAAALKAKRSFKGLLLPTAMQCELEALTEKTALPSAASVAVGASSSMLVSPDRPRRTAERGAVQRFVNRILDIICSYGPPDHTSGEMSDANSAVICLCQRVVGQCTSDEERRTLESIVFPDWDKVTVEQRFFPVWSVPKESSTAVSVLSEEMQKAKKDAQLTRALQVIIEPPGIAASSDVSTRLNAAWVALGSKLMRPIIVIEAGLTQMRFCDHVVKVTSDIDGVDIPRIHRLAASEKRPLVVLIDEVFDESQPATPRFTKLIKSCGEVACIVWPNGYSAINHPSYKELFGSGPDRKYKFQEPFHVYLGGKSDVYSRWLRYIDEELTMRLERGIHVTQSFLMLSFDCFFSVSCESQKRAVRTYLNKVFTTEVRAELVDKILDVVAASFEYGKLVRREADPVAYQTLLDFISSTRK